MLTDKELQAELDSLTAYLHKHCTIGDVMNACGHLLTEAEPRSLSGVAHADQAIRNMAHRHGKPASVTAVLVLAELTRILDGWVKVGARVP